jgi:uncharacterized protein involved in exopolysaccharide biosynthesis
MNEDVRSDVLFRRALSRWTWILGLAVVGGLLGWGVSLVRAPAYMAEANLLIGVDYARTQPLSEDAAREAFLEVQNLLLSDETLQGAIDLLPPGTTSPNSIAAFRRTIRLERFDPKWDLQVLSTDSQQAAQWANAWARSALASLAEAQRHAWRAADIQAAMYQAGCTWAPGEPPDHQPRWHCESQNPAFSPEEAVTGVMAESARSHGILPALTFSLQNEATPPDQPIIYGRGGVILAGVFLGWILGIGLAVGASEGRGSAGQGGEG